MFVMIAEMKVKAGHVDAFLEKVEAQAKSSVDEEPGCRQFDVCRSEDDRQRIVLYEVYDDAAAFDAHLETERFEAFFENIGPMLAAEPELRRFERLFANRE